MPMPAKEFVVGVDIGTMGSKGVLVDSEGSICGEHFVAHDINVIKPGWVEQDPELCYWRDFKEIVQYLMKTTRISSQDIAGVGISGLFPDVVAIDRSGQPVRPCITYMDRRAGKECDWVRENIGAEKVFQVSGNTVDPYFAGNKILWYMHNEPANYAKTWKILNADKYVIMKLAGEAVIDHSIGPLFSPLFDYRKKSWSEEMCQATDVDVEKLPKAYASHQKIGEITPEAERETGLAKGTPVIAGGGDAIQSLLSVGGLDDGESCFMYGTTGCWVIVQDEPKFDPRLINTCYTVPGKYVSFGGMITTGALVKWFRDQFGQVEKQVGESLDVSPYRILDLQAEKVPAGCDGLVVLPYFMGERTPIWEPSARGMIFGLTLYHTRAHIYRALLEASGYGLKQHMEVAKSAGIKVKNMTAVDGGARSRIWRQIISDITDFPQLYAARAAGAPFGDAFLAGVSVGVFRSFEQIKTVSEVKEEVIPNKALHEVYARLYHVYLQLYPHTREEAREIHSISSKVC